MRNPGGEGTAGCCVNESRALQARGDGKQIPGSKQEGISGKVFHFSVKLLSYCSVLETQRKNTSQEDQGRRVNPGSSGKRDFVHLGNLEQVTKMVPSRQGKCEKIPQCPRLLAARNPAGMHCACQHTCTE